MICVFSLCIQAKDWLHALSSCRKNSQQNQSIDHLFVFFRFFWFNFESLDDPFYKEENSQREEGCALLNRPIFTARTTTTMKMLKVEVVFQLWFITCEVFKWAHTVFDLCLFFHGDYQQNHWSWCKSSTQKWWFTVDGGEKSCKQKVWNNPKTTGRKKDERPPN